MAVKAFAYSDPGLDVSTAAHGLGRGVRSCSDGMIVRTVQHRSCMIEICNQDFLLQCLFVELRNLYRH